MSAPKPFTVAHFRAWARGLELDNGKPWVLEPFQIAFLRDVFAGTPECWLVIPEGNAKTTLVAGIALYHAEFRRFAAISAAAASREQAELLYRQAESFVVRSEIEDRFTCLGGFRRIRCEKTKSRLQIMAADDRTGDGIIPTLAVLDELHRHRDLRLYRTWLGKIGKRGGQVIAISTAGEPGSEFERTREAIRQSGTTTRKGTYIRAEGPGIVLHEYAVPEDGDVEDLHLVKAANPLKAITLTELKRKRSSPTMTLEHWRRFVCNLPTRASDAAIREREWFAARVDDAIPAGEPIWLGFDFADQWDTTALVPLWIRDPEYRLLGPATILVPPEDGTKLDRNEVMAAITYIHERNPIHTVVMDPSARADSMFSEWMEGELGCVVVERQQTPKLAAMDFARFIEALANGWLKHTGDEGLTRHVLNAVALPLPWGDHRFGRRSKTRQGGDQRSRVIDALIAAAMVHTTATAKAEEDPPVYYSLGA